MPLSSPTVAGLIVEALHAAGVQRLFGMPGGGSNLDLIEAGQVRGLPFVLAHTETAAALMACAEAELTGHPGVCLCTLGPGVASIVNGVAHAYLDRVPLLVFSDRHPDSAQACLHQRLDHQAIFAPVTKKRFELTRDDARRILEEALATAVAPPAGPVHIDCPSDVLSGPPGSRTAPHPAPPVVPPPAPLPPALARLVAHARRPLVLAGLGAASAPAAQAVRAFCEAHAVPAMVTYKAKGVLPDGHPLYAGVFTNGAIERPILDRADLLIGAGLDPVELLPRPWNHAQPILYCGPPLPAQRHVPFAAGIAGELPAALASLAAGRPGGTDWDPDEPLRAVAGQRAALRVDAPGLAPFRAIEVVAAAVGPDARVTVDAGAHMFPAVGLWPVVAPRQMLISNGLSTMGFALPTAIGAALTDRGRRTVAITGDGGLLMCAGELRTAAREQLPLLVVVLNDASLSLIRIKQDGKGYAPAGVGIGEVDWRAVAGAMGVPAWRADDAASLRDSLRAALVLAGPACIEARVDGQSYATTLKAVRG